MLIRYTTTIRDELLDLDIIPDLECELDVDVGRDCGDVVFDVTAVFVKDKNLNGGTAWAQSIGAGIATEATDKLNTQGTRVRERAFAALEREAA